MGVRKQDGPLQAEFLAESINLVHALVEDSNDADISVRETAPIDKMPFVLEEISLYSELRGDGLRGVFNITKNNGCDVRWNASRTGASRSQMGRLALLDELKDVRI
ncbi:hypothetical protein O9Z70_04880 [Devosia sp. YIM 151766]|uniref:hypothetical protein n=1 Tax=Devosia sp. YIM 151766 TaxID=3017325 RepID=UPI00255C524F|nr:hypothetical protein [Devosia sp. YIM 151766]WIY53878.1 hypothetical protein O9Z70_04880 [Devosia sp. YIM 151766]